MEYLIYLAITLSALGWGAWMDYKIQEIPNIVHVLLIIGAFFNTHVSAAWQIIGFIIMPAIILFANFVTRQPQHGGDIKLLAALGANAGLLSCLPIISLCAAFAAVWCLKTRMRSIPMCTFIFAGYVSYLVLGVVLFGT